MAATNGLWKATSIPKLSPDEETLLLERLCQYSLANGLVMYPPGFEVAKADIAPITLFPTPFPRDLFEKALKVQKTFNLLYSLVVSTQKSWLLAVSRDLASYDKDFTGKLYETYNEAVKLGGGKVLQPLTLGLFRSDYMFDEQEHSIKQIEFNTVSVSFGGLSTKVGQLHDYLNKSSTYDPQGLYYGTNIPISNSIKDLALGLATANNAYSSGSSSSQGGKRPVVLFIVQDKERNCFDQRHVEYSLLDIDATKSYRCTLEAAKDFTYVEDGIIRIKSSSEEVGVVYYRSGYSPSDYESNPELTWGARLYLENTNAIKCPSLLTQLSGTKKVQQALTDLELLHSFMPDLPKSDLRELQDTFVKIYPLDNSKEGQLAKKLAFESPERFVLKPQREGGGNNIYKTNIPGFLNSIDESEWGAYILMDIINPPTYENKILRQGKILSESILLELGIFGTILFNEDSGQVLSCDNAGHLLRSKVSSSDEGGVAAGFGCLDNIYLQEN